MPKKEIALKPLTEGYQTLQKGYTTNDDSFNFNNPPQGGSGVPISQQNITQQSSDAKKTQDNKSK